MNFKVGDKVKVIDETSEGIIIEICSINKIIVETDGFEFSYRSNQLMKDRGIPAVDVSSKTVYEKEFSQRKKQSKKHQRKGNIVEVDLHINELVYSTMGLTNGEMLQIQLSHFQRELESAILDRASKIVFIHGVGEGVLRAEIRRYLKSYEGIEYHDASYVEYGSGATEVIIYNNY